ncbi:UPF0179 protein [Leptolyngbya sp. BL0902]|nr:UPF0179 protein [Leptolyngbya sp. BL0902]
MSFFTDYAAFQTPSKFQRDWEKFKAGKARQAESQVVNYEKTIELATTLPQIAQTEVNPDLFIQISKFIDQGEAILTVHITEILQKDEEFQAFIFTGDKNYLRALYQSSMRLSIIEGSDRCCSYDGTPLCH